MAGDPNCTGAPCGVNRHRVQALSVRGCPDATQEAQRRPAMLYRVRVASGRRRGNGADVKEGMAMVDRSGDCAPPRSDQIWSGDSRGPMKSVTILHTPPPHGEEIWGRFPHESVGKTRSKVRPRRGRHP